jgi:hypothetical protein
MNNLKTYLPRIYKNILEFDNLMEVENELFNKLNLETNKVKNNQYILTADLDGIIMYEKMLGIIANPAIEDIEFRRNRIINRISMTLPFTFRFLKQRLDEIIGKDRWKAYLDFDNYTLYIESSAANQMWFHEILVTINKLKPANIVFINKPLIAEDILVSEKINLSEVIFNYRLGTSWVLGLKPFTSLENMGVIKTANVPSIKQEMLNGIAEFTSSDIAKVRVNESLIITDFIIKESTQNIVTIEYQIALESGITEVTKVELLDVMDNVLTESLVYVPILEAIILKHTIQIKEGV